MGLFDFVGFGKKKAAIIQALKSGAVVIDVREPSEFERGHVEGSLNIPLGKISSKANSISKKYSSVVTCCRSGIRSSQAAGILKNSGVEVYNGGSWQTVRAYSEE